MFLTKVNTAVVHALILSAAATSASGVQAQQTLRWSDDKLSRFSDLVVVARLLAAALKIKARHS